MGNSCIRDLSSPFPRTLPVVHQLTKSEASCPMLRSLHADADTQAHLTTFTPLTSLAQLYNTCKLWRRWLILPQQSGHKRPKHSVDLTAESLPHMLRCGWLLQTATEINTEAKDSGERHFSELEKPSGQQRLVQLLQSLPRFARLDALRMHFESTFLPPPPQLHALLLPFAGRLRSLTVKPFDNQCEVGFKAICAHLSLFERLESLRVVATHEPSTSMDLSALPALKCLHTFHFDTVYYEQVTLAQAKCLAQCRSLTSLEFGAWGPRRKGDPDNVAALTIFVNSRLADPDPSSSSSSASSSSSLTPVATLTDFRFLYNELTAAGWDQLSRLPSLNTVLYLYPVDLSITKEAWARLGQFTQLTELNLSSPNPLNDTFQADSLALNTDHLWPPILQMTALTELRVSRCNLKPHHITSLTALPVLQLTVFGQCHLCFEDLNTVSAVCTPHRKIWIVGTSYGDKRTEVQNLLLPEVKQDGRWRRR